MNRKQVRINRLPTADGIPVGQFIDENADPIWLHQNEMWELMPVEEPISDPASPNGSVVMEDEYGIAF